MSNKKPGEGLHIMWEIISKGIEYRLASFKELLSELWSITDDNKQVPRDLKSDQEDYLSGKK